MKIASVRIENFRSFKDQTIFFDNYNCLVGPNGAGKSTVFNALNVFFRNAQSSPGINLLELRDEDFHCKDTSSPVRITVTFVDLSEQAREDLKDYVRHDQLIVLATAEWSAETCSAPVLQKGIRMGMAEFSEFFKSLNDGDPVAHLKTVYTRIRDSGIELPPPGVKAAMVEALRKYEDTHQEKCVPLESDDEFYGITKGAHKLAPYIQWIFVPAVKDASEEQTDAKNTGLSLLIERVVRSKVNFDQRIEQLRETTSKAYVSILEENQTALQELSTSLKARLSKWAHPDVDLFL